MKKINRRYFVMGSLGLAAVSVPALCRALGKEIGRMEADSGIFRNPMPTTINTNGGALDSAWRWMTTDNIREPRQTFRFQPDELPTGAPPKEGLRVMWLGHSTVYIEIDGKRFLADPMWSRRSSPVPFLGPARFFPVPVDLETLPQLDGVIISHDHYDHLDHPTILSLAKTGTRFYTPLGVGKRLSDWGVARDRITELNWWGQIPVGDTHELVALPARHFSGRGMLDRNKTLWAAWAVIGKKHRVFFGGDGGLFPGFREIGDRLGPFDMTFLEIGAYDRNWDQIHLGPDNAVQAHRDLRGDTLLPIHWGTFNLAIHAWTEPVVQLISAAGNRIKLALPEPGRFVSQNDTRPVSRWWEA